MTNGRRPEAWRWLDIYEFLNDRAKSPLAIAPIPQLFGGLHRLCDASAIVVGSSRYDPFGNVMNQSAATSVFAFAGEQQDATGLEYLRARYYSSAQGRFVTRDVWAGDPNAPMSYNAWLYVYANPINSTDPAGLQGPTPCPAGYPGRNCPTPTTTPFPTSRVPCPPQGSQWIGRPERPFTPTPTPRPTPLPLTWELILGECGLDKRSAKIIEDVLGAHGTPEGYLSGASMAITDQAPNGPEPWHLKVTGIEVVFNFKHHEKAVFSFASTFAASTDMFSVSGSSYESFIWGFGSGIREDYPGFSTAVGVQAGIPGIKLFGGGVSVFSTSDSSCTPNYALTGIGDSFSTGLSGPSLGFSVSRTCAEYRNQLWDRNAYQKYPPGREGAMQMSAEIAQIGSTDVLKPLARQAALYVLKYQ